MPSNNAIIKRGCGHLGELNHEDHYCDPGCIFRDEDITHSECRNCSITLDLPTKRCYFEM